MRLCRRGVVSVSDTSSYKGYRFPPDVIILAVRWYLRYGLSYRDVEELLGERRIEVDHATIYRWVQRFTPLLADAAGPCRRLVADRWFIDETYVKIAGKWCYVGTVALAHVGHRSAVLATPIVRANRTGHEIPVCLNRIFGARPQPASGRARSAQQCRVPRAWIFTR